MRRNDKRQKEPSRRYFIIYVRGTTYYCITYSSFLSASIVSVGYVNLRHPQKLVEAETNHRVSLYCDICPVAFSNADYAKCPDTG